MLPRLRQQYETYLASEHVPAGDLTPEQWHTLAPSLGGLADTATRVRLALGAVRELETLLADPDWRVSLAASTAIMALLPLVARPDLFAMALDAPRKNRDRRRERSRKLQAHIAKLRKTASGRLEDNPDLSQKDLAAALFEQDTDNPEANDRTLKVGTYQGYLTGLKRSLGLLKKTRP
jgi:hypothetical protein